MDIFRAIRKTFTDLLAYSIIVVIILLLGLIFSLVIGALLAYFIVGYDLLIMIMSFVVGYSLAILVLFYEMKKK